MINTMARIATQSARASMLNGRSYERKRIREQRSPRGRNLKAQLGLLSSSNSLLSIIEAVADGRISTEDAARTIEKQCSAETLLEPRHRVEVVDADGMPTSQLAAVLANLAGKQHCAAARHVDSEVYATIRSMLPGVQYHGGARMLLYTDPHSDLPKVEKLPGNVAIVCGSGADVQMAYEAKVALQLQGGYSTMIRDMSPTKLGELFSRKEYLQMADVVIVCCGEQPALAGLILGLVDVPVVAIPGDGGRTDPNLAIPVAGACATAPGDGVSAANVAVRTLHVAKQYIEHRKGREGRKMVQCMGAEHMQTPDEYLDRQPVTLTLSHSDTAFDSAFIGAHGNGGQTNGKAMKGTYINGTAVNRAR